MSYTSLNKKLEQWNGLKFSDKEENQKVALELNKEILKIIPELKKNINDKILKNLLNSTSKYPFLKYLADKDAQIQWAEAVFKIIQATNYSLNDLFEQRIQDNGKHILFQDMTEGSENQWTYQQIYLHIREIATVIYTFQSKDPPRVAILCENSVESACSDLACLCFDIFNTPLNIHFNLEILINIFDRLNLNVAITDTSERLKLLEKVRAKTKTSFTILVTDPHINTNEKDIFFLGEECKSKNKKEIESTLNNRKKKKISEVATTMFTSGSTGMPKGVSFSIYNLVSKRFARAAALPEIGNQEAMLCFLPLFHTFGRFLEMLGTIYWRGTYAFTGNPSSERLLSLFPKVNPTIFISIPLRWMQLYEKAMESIESTDSKAERIKKLQKIAGNRLKWGLSAAGYLDPKIFQFFQDHDILLCSGFGMTEATGGITMTPPGKYIESTTGIPLPGCNVRFGENNELEISGHYIARYLEDAGPGESIAFPVSEKKDNWLPTGDIFRQTKEGYYEIVDRVKDIYKNNKGQTIAPRNVEKLFVDVPGIKQTFLVGDARPYNVLLIIPDREDPVLKASPSMDNQEEYFHQIITAANKDLAPYERVINFSLLERNFEVEKGELTPKGSYNRKIITENFQSVIEGLYKSNTINLSYKNLKVSIPRWFFRDLGILENDVSFNSKGLINKQYKLTLPIVKDKENNRILIGDLYYTIEGNTIDLGLFTRQPKLWIANPSLISFCPCKEGWDLPLNNVSVQVQRPKQIEKIYTIEDLPVLNNVRDQKIILINGILSFALFGDTKTSFESTQQIRSIIRQNDENITEVIRRRLEALAYHSEESIRALGYRILLLDDPNPDYSKLFPAFIQSGLTFLNEESITKIAKRDMGKQHLESLRQRLHVYRMQLEWPADKEAHNQFNNVLKLLFNFASNHFEYYNSVRAELASWILHKNDPYLSKKAKEYFKDIYLAFEKEITRKHSKLNAKQWKKKIVFEEGIASKDCDQILKTISTTSMIIQSVMLAYDDFEFSLNDIKDQGIWISRVLTYGNFNHYRLSINTSTGKHFDFHFVINKGISYSSGAESVYWLAAISGYPYATLSMPALGCYLPKEGVLTTKYISELSIWEKIREFSGIHHSLGYINIRNPWRKLFIKGLAVFYKVWEQSGYRIVPGAVSPTNVVVPELDYLETATIISVAGLQEYENTLSLVKPMIDNFFLMLAAHYPWCKKQLSITWIFDACIEALGYKKGIGFLEKLQTDLEQNSIIYDKTNLKTMLDQYLNDLAEKFYLPLALYNATDQYKEWEKINPLATPQAKEQTIFELSGLYRIYRFPEIVRYHFYRDTYFANTNDVVSEAFDILLEKMAKNFKIPATHLIELSDLQSVIEDQDDKLIFSRMVFSRLQRQQKMDIVKVGDDKKEQVIVKSYINDKHGVEYTFREPMEPSEIGKLYRLFFEENYPKSISEMDKHMVVVDQQERVIGGLCYIPLENEVVLLDGSAVTTPLKGRGIGTAMIDTFCSRMASEGIKVIKAHFLLGNFYLKLNFKVDQKWGALVKFL